MRLKEALVVFVCRCSSRARAHHMGQSACGTIELTCRTIGNAYWTIGSAYGTIESANGALESAYATI